MAELDAAKTRTGVTRERRSRGADRGAVGPRGGGHGGPASSHDGHHHGHDHQNESERHDHDHGDHDHGDHDHAAALRSTPSRKLARALALTVGFMLVEVGFGFATHSLSLLSDAAHMVTDAAALALALVAQRLAERPRTATLTYGYRRAETLAALANGVALAASSVWIVREGIERWSRPAEIRGPAMLAIATLGLVVNLVSAKMLSHGHGAKNANVRAAMAHVVADALGSVAAMIAGALVVWARLDKADTVASILIAVLVLRGAWQIVRSSSRVLMESAPEGLDEAKVAAVLRAVPGVVGYHDLHVWQLAEGEPMLTVHVAIAEGAHGVEVARAVARAIARELGIVHATVQPEVPSRPRLVPAASLVRRSG